MMTPCLLFDACFVEINEKSLGSQENVRSWIGVRMCFFIYGSFGRMLDFPRTTIRIFRRLCLLRLFLCPSFLLLDIGWEGFSIKVVRNKALVPAALLPAPPPR